MQNRWKSLGRISGVSPSRGVGKNIIWMTLRMQRAILMAARFNLTDLRVDTVMEGHWFITINGFTIVGYQKTCTTENVSDMKC